METKCWARALSKSSQTSSTEIPSFSASSSSVGALPVCSAIWRHKLPGGADLAVHAGGQQGGPPQLIQHGPFDPDVGVGLELDLVGGVEIPGRLEQSHGAGRHQVLERQRRLDVADRPAGDLADHRQQLEDFVVADAAVLVPVVGAHGHGLQVVAAVRAPDRRAASRGSVGLRRSDAVLWRRACL